MDTQEFLKAIRSDNADTRFTAWRAAGEVSPEVIPELGKLAGSENPGMAKSASEALTTITHSVGKDPKSANREAVIKGLLGLTSSTYPVPVRTHAFRLLSNIAGEESVPAIAREIGNADLREEVVYCLERIPGDASVQALLAAYKQAGDDFKPRLLAAFGHRRVTAASAVCNEAMKSPNPDVAIAAAKAFGRIGAKLSGAPAWLSESGLSEWQKIERMDSVLRYADAQAAAGNHAEALPIYRAALDRPEEHWQCAGIAGAARIGTSEAAALILPKLKSANPTVRITAQNAWKGIASA